MFVKLFQKFCFIGMALSAVSLLLFTKMLLHVALLEDGKDYWVHILFVWILITMTTVATTTTTIIMLDFVVKINGTTIVL